MKGSKTPEDTNEAIMEATYRALSKHGYPSTSISKIANEFEKSKSLLYYHYEDKDELLEDFLRFLLDRLEENLAEIDCEDPYDYLRSVLERLLPPEIDDEQFQFMRALLEIRSQAPYHEVYHEQFERSDNLILLELTSVIERGIEDDRFRQVNSRQTAEFIYSAAYGAVERGATLEESSVIEENRQLLTDYIDSQLLKYT